MIWSYLTYYNRWKFSHTGKNVFGHFLGLGNKTPRGMDKQCLIEQPYERDLNGDCPVVVDQDATTRPHSNLFVDQWSNFTLFYKLVVHQVPVEYE